MVIFIPIEEKVTNTNPPFVMNGIVLIDDFRLAYKQVYYHTT